MFWRQLSLDVLTKCLRAHALGKFPNRSEDKHTSSWHLSWLDENLRTDNYLHLTSAPHKSCGASFRRQRWSSSQWCLLRTKSQCILKFQQTTCLHFKSCQNKNKNMLYVIFLYSHFGHSWKAEVAEIRWVNLFWKALHRGVTSQAFGEAARRNLVFKATFLSFHLSQVFNDPLLQKVPCCCSSVLLNDPSLGRTLLNPRFGASGSRDEWLGGWPQTARSKDSQLGTCKSTKAVSNTSLLVVLLLACLHNALKMGNVCCDPESSPQAWALLSCDSQCSSLNWDTGQ